MIKDILVYLDGSEQDAYRLSYADGVAGVFTAHLTGLYVNLIPQIVMAGDGGMLGIDMAIEVESEALAGGRSHMDAIAHRMEAVSVPHSLERLDVHSELAPASLASAARLHDLFIATRPYGHERESLTAPGIEGVLFDSGRPCLFVPPDYQGAARFDTIVLAWKDSRPAARALAASLPILSAAQRVVVLAVEDGRNAATEAGALDKLVTHLGRHDIAVEPQVVMRSDKVSRTLLEAAHQFGADCLVMGGFGHSRLAEWVLGGTTRAALTQADLPVLVGH